MKFIFKIFFTCFLMIICYNISSQNSIIESREEREIKLIFKNFISKKSKISFNLGIDNPLNLPAYFTNYTEYFYRVKDTSKISLFNFVYSNNSKLNKSDCDILNNTILNDTNRLYIEKRL